MTIGDGVMRLPFTDSSILVIVFFIGFTICGIKVLAGYPLGPCLLLACSILSFFAGIMQILENLIAASEKGKKKTLEELHKTQKDDEIAVNNVEELYRKQIDVYKNTKSIVMFIALLSGMCLLIFGGDYENNVLSDGLTLLAIAFFFLSISINDIAESIISAFKIK